MTSGRPFRQVDVFTDVLGLGNPVAVVHDADGLDDAAMAAFANWTNLSETTFLLAPTEPGADYRLRIFTTARELPFAGHPTLGSARAWLDAGGIPASADGVIVQQCVAGLIPVRRDGSRLAFDAPPLVRSGPVDEGDVRTLLAGLGLAADRVRGVEWVANGPQWVGVLVDSAATVLGLTPTSLAPFTDVGVIGPYPAGHDPAFEVRAFVGDAGLWEDPVTGSLNAGLGQWLVGAGLAPTSYVAAQGTRLGRRGRVHVDATSGVVRVGGDTVIGVTGTVALPR